MEIYLIRHGQTPGNAQGRYVGKTDESLSEMGREAAGAKCSKMPQVDCLMSSPMKRCVESAGLLFPGHEILILDGIEECDFGDFEYRNYEELKDNPDYQRWIDSGGTLGFPHGESKAEFTARVAHAFETGLKSMLSQEKDAAMDTFAMALVCHGGSIMAILDSFSQPHRDYFDWQAKGLCGFRGELGLTEDGQRLRITDLREFG